MRMCGGLPQTAACAIDRAGTARETNLDQGGRRAHHPADHPRAPPALRRLRLQPARSPALSGHAFGSGPPFTVGVEEELFLVDPVTGAQINASTAVQERIGAGARARSSASCTPVSSSSSPTSVTAPARRSPRSTACGGPSSAPARGCSARGRIRRPPKARPRSPTRSATSASATCSATPSPRRSAACTSTSGCRTPRRRSAPSTACAGTSRCCRPWPPTRRFATAATPAWPRPAR